MTVALETDLLAVIYLLDNTETRRWARVCMDWCEAHRYELVSVVVDGTATGEKWASVVGMLATGEAHVCVVPRWDHLHPERLPRVEVIAEEVGRGEEGPGRPRIIGA